MQYKIYDFNNKQILPELKKQGIYKIETSDNRCYVGSAGRNFRHRWTGHLHSLRNNKHHSQYLQNIFNKYGEDFLQFSILEVVTKDKEQLISREQYWIDLLQPCLNICPNAGNNLGYKHTEEFKLNRSKQSREKSDFEGVVITQTGRFSAQIYVRGNRVGLGCYGTREEALQAREEGKLTFWNDSVDAMSEEELAVFIKQRKESRNGYLMMPSKTGEYYIDFQRNRYIFKHTRPKYHCKYFKTLEEAVIYRDAYLASGCSLETPKKVANSGEKHIRVTDCGNYRFYIRKPNYSQIFKTLEEAVAARDAYFAKDYKETSSRKPPKSGHKLIRETRYNTYEFRHSPTKHHKYFPTLEEAVAYKQQYLENLKASHQNPTDD